MEDAQLWECVAPMTVFLLMQVALGGGRGWAGENELLWQGERRETWIGGGYIATTIYSLYLGSFCNEMACVMEALSKQWAYSAQRAVSVGTGLNTIPLIQGCGHSFLSILVFYTLLTVEITSSHLSLCLPAEKKVCNRVVQRPRDKKNVLMCTFEKISLSLFISMWTSPVLPGDPFSGCTCFIMSLDFDALNVVGTLRWTLI